MIDLSAPIGTGKTRGFTLVEMIMTMVILSVMVLFTLTFIYQAVQTYVAVNERFRSWEECKFAIERMVREIREADSIIYPPPGTANASRVQISEPSGSGIVEFRFSNGKIVRNDDQHPITGPVSNFTVERTSESDFDFGSNKLTLWMTFITDDGQSISTSMQVVPKNLPWPPGGSYPKKCFNKSWREIVAQ